METLGFAPCPLCNIRRSTHIPKVRRCVSGCTRVEHCSYSCRLHWPLALLVRICALSNWLVGTSYCDAYCYSRPHPYYVEARDRTADTLARGTEKETLRLPNDRISGIIARRIKRIWFSGRTRPCQGRDRGSIPRIRTTSRHCQGSIASKCTAQKASQSMLCLCARSSPSKLQFGKSLFRYSLVISSALSGTSIPLKPLAKKSLRASWVLCPRFSLRSSRLILKILRYIEDLM